jgi:hypothetical protein
MESQFRHDFSRVRIHADVNGRASARAMSADAYTAGHHIVLGNGLEGPGTPAARHLLAHELAHVVQQERGRTASYEASNGSRDSFEAEADAAADSVAAGRPAEIVLRGSPPAIQLRRHRSRPPRPAPGSLLYLQQEHPEIEREVGAIARLFHDLFDQVNPSLRQADRGQNFRDTAQVALSLETRSLQRDDFSPRAMFRWLRAVRGALRFLEPLLPSLETGVATGGVISLAARREYLETRARTLGQTRFMREGEEQLAEESRQQQEASRAAEERQRPQPLQAAPEPVDPERQYVENLYVTAVCNNIYREDDGGWRLNAAYGMPAFESLVRYKANEILLDQRAEILSRRTAMLRSWGAARGGERDAIVNNVRRAKTVVLNAQRLREQLRADETRARSLGILTRPFSDSDWDVLRDVSAPRSMRGLEGERLPPVDTTRRRVVEYFREHRRRGETPSLIVRSVAHDVVRVARQDQAQAVTVYINAVYHRMPFLRYLIENDQQVNVENLSTVVGQGSRELLQANAEARGAIFRIDALAMEAAVDAAIRSLPHEVQDDMRLWVAQERREQASLDALESLGIAAGLVLLALVPVVGPTLAFAAGVGFAVRGEVQFQYENVLADASIAPDEELLGVARPGTFEVWMNRLGPILDIAFAGAGRAVSAMSRSTRAARGALEVARVEMEVAEAGLRELPAAEYAARVARLEETGEISQAGARALQSQADRRVAELAQRMDDEAFDALARERTGGAFEAEMDEGFRLAQEPVVDPSQPLDPEEFRGASPLGRAARSETQPSIHPPAEPSAPRPPRTGPGQAPPADGEFLELPSGTVHMGLDEPAAQRSFMDSLQESPDREAGVWMDLDTGERVVVQGDQDRVPVDWASRPELAGRRWILEEHFHPGTRYIDRFASPQDFEHMLHAQLHGGAPPAPVETTIRWHDAENHRLVETTIAFDPARRDAYSIRYIDADGVEQTRRFADAPWQQGSTYQDFLGQQHALAGEAAHPTALGPESGGTGGTSTPLSAPVAPRAPETPVVSQTRHLTAADMLRWERLDGHTLRRHGSHHTRRTLLQRIIGESGTPGHLQVWAGAENRVASRWLSDDDMREVIGDVINQNLSEINDAIARGASSWTGQQLPVGRHIGEGWVMTGSFPPHHPVPGAQRGVMWRESLEHVTVVIRPDGRGSWFVYTAYPDVAP